MATLAEPFCLSQTLSYTQQGNGQCLNYIIVTVSNVA